MKIKLLSFTSQVAASVVQLSAVCKRYTPAPVLHLDGSPRVSPTETYDPCSSAECDLCVAKMTTEQYCAPMLKLHVLRCVSTIRLNLDAHVIKSLAQLNTRGYREGGTRL